MSPSVKKRRVVVTGLGTVSCFGSDIEKFYQSLLDGKSGAKEITQFPVEEYPTRFAAPVADFETDGYMEKKQARRADPCISYAVVAGKKALEHAGIDWENLDRSKKTRYGVLVGSGMGGMKAFTDGILTVHEKGYKRLTPFFVPYIITNMPGALLAIDLGFMGPNYSISTACATGTHSIISAAKHIQYGDADVMVCGGAEGSMNKTCLTGFIACRALSTRNDDPQTASRPWDKTREGFVIGEGCGALVLESLEHAQARGATIYAEYLGGSVNCDANHMTDPVADGSVVASCITSALEDADVKKERVDYVNAHATSTVVGDMCEIRAIKKAFGDHSKGLKINATKSMLGHCLGAAGGMEALATVLSIHKKKLHPTINLKDPEEELGDLDPIKDGPIDADIDVAVSNSFGFGGHNATLVFGKFK